MRYYIADLHFFHEALNENMDCRGFASAAEMNEYILARWNAKVRPGDDVVILGDVSLGSAEQTSGLLKELHGRLYLIEGNHDHFLRHRKFDASVFQWVKPYEELKDNKRKVVLCHYPVFCYNGQYRTGEDGRPLTYMLYGHVHNTKDEILVDQFIHLTRQTMHQARGADKAESIPCQMINCFCMFSDYTPLTLDEWIMVDEQRRAQMGQNRSDSRLFDFSKCLAPSGLL